MSAFTEPGGTGGGVASSVSVTNFPGTQPVTGSVGINGITFPENVTVTGSVGITNTVPVSFPGGVNVTSTGSLSVSVSNFPVTQSVFVGNTVPVQVQGTPTVNATVTSTGSVAVALLNQPTVFVTSTGSLSTAVTNFPATQTITGTVALSTSVHASPSGSLLTTFGSSQFTLTTTLLTGSGDSNALSMLNFSDVSITAEIAGNLSGTLSIQVANTVAVPSSAQWATVTQPNTSAVVVSGSASSPVVWILPKGPAWARVDYVSAISGSGTINAYGTARGG